MDTTYRIGVDIVGDTSGGLRELRGVLDVLREMRDATRDSQSAFKAMASVMSQMARDARTIAAAMRQASQASAGFRPSPRYTPGAPGFEGGSTAGSGLVLPPGYIRREEPPGALFGEPNGTYYRRRSGVYTPWFYDREEEAPSRAAERSVERERERERERLPVAPPVPPRGPGWRPSFYDMYFVGDAIATAVRPGWTVAQERARLSGTAFRGEADALIQEELGATFRPESRGTDFAGNAAIMTQLLSMTQNAEESRAIFRRILPAGLALQTLNPDAGDYAHQLEAVSQTLEYLGGITKQVNGKTIVDEQRVVQFTQDMVRAAATTQGRFSPDKVYQFLTSAKTAGVTMDPDTLLQMWPLVQALKPHNAGTALNSFAQQFVQGRQSQHAVDELIRLGLIKGGGDAKHNRYVRPAFGQYIVSAAGMDRGALVQAITRPVDFVEQHLLPVAQKDVLAHMNMTPEQFSTLPQQKQLGFISAEMGTLASRIPGGSFLSEAVRNYQLGLRDMAAQKNLPSDYTQTLAGAPNNQLAAFTNQFSTLVATLSGPGMATAIHALQEINKALGWANQETERHPVKTAVAGASLAAVGTGVGIEVGRAALGGALRWGGTRLGTGLLARGLTGLGGAVGFGAGWPVAAGIAATVGAYETYEHWDAIKNWFHGIGSTTPPANMPPVPVRIINPQDIGRATNSAAATQIAAPHTGSPSATSRAVPQAPGSR